MKRKLIILIGLISLFALLAGCLGTSYGGDPLMEGDNFTSGYVPYIDADGNLSGDADLTWDADNDALKTKTGRTATYVIAASDATALEKAQADYVCDGTADEVEINAAIKALPDKGGTIKLCGGNFYQAARIEIDHSVQLIGNTIDSPQIWTAAGYTDTDQIHVYQTLDNLGVTHLHGTIIEGIGVFAQNDPTINTGIYLNQPDSEIRNCWISYHDTHDIYVAAWHCSINHNALETSDGYAIYSDDSSFLSVTQNICANKKGIYINHYDTTHFGYSTFILNNDISRCDTESPIIINYAENVQIVSNVIHNLNNLTIPAIDIKGSNSSGYQMGKVIVANNQIHPGLLSDYGTTKLAIGIKLANYRIDYVDIHDNDLHLCTTPIYDLSTGSKSIYNVHGLIHDNLGYIASGERKAYSGELVRAVENGGVIVWQNPEAQALMVTGKVRITSGGGAGVTGPMGLVTSSVLEDCEDAWDESHDADCTVTVDTYYKERGSGCVKLAVAGTVSNGDLLATESIAAKDLSSATHVLLKIMTSSTVAVGDLQLLLDEHASCVSPSETINIPAMATVNRTYQFVLPLVSDVGDRNAIISIGLKYTANAKANNIYIDDVRYCTIGTTFLTAPDLNTTGIYDSCNATDGAGKPIYISAKNGDSDTLVMVSTGGAASTIIGSYYIEGIGLGN